MLIGVAVSTILISAFTASICLYLLDNKSDQIDSTLESSINSAIQSLIDRKGIEVSDGPGYPTRKYVYDKQTKLLVTVYQVNTHHKVYVVRKNKRTVYTSGEMRLVYKPTGNWYNRLLYLAHSP